MKRTISHCVLAMCMALLLTPSALAAQDPVPLNEPQVCYPTYTVRSEDGAEIRKVYDLSPEDDPAGIPRSDFEQDGFHYTLLDVLRQEAPEYEERLHTETVTVESKNKDMESVLALLPQQREFVTDDGLSGTLTLKLDTVRVEVAGYTSSTKKVSATRSYPNLAGQDTQYIPKTVEDGGRTLTLESIDWQTDSAAGDSYTLGERYTAVATYTGSATSRSVSGYTVTADYTGAVSRIVLNKVRYVAVFEGESLEPVQTPAPTAPAETEAPEPTQEGPASSTFNWAVLLFPLFVVILSGAGVGVALLMKKHSENEAPESEDEAE